MPKTIPHIAQTNAPDILDVVIPTPQPSDVAPRLDDVNAVTAPILASLINQCAMGQAYITALLASHEAKDRQIAALKDKLAPRSPNGTEG
jgi:L-rhamnose isomerase